MAPEIDVWVSCASTYTYLTIVELTDAERNFGVRFNLRPFYLGALFKEAGYFPFPDGAVKTAYMWSDVARRAQERGLKPKLPAPYPPPDAVRANQVAYLALKRPWGRDYMVASYKAWFEHGLMPGGHDNLSASFDDIGQDVDAILAEVEKGEAHEALVAETDTARSLGIFGAPTFVVGNDLFWGSDRLEDAVKWLRHHTC